MDELSNKPGIIKSTGWACSQCGMSTRGPADYHPYAACLMFMGCRNGNTVQANLDAVVKHGRELERKEQERAQMIADSSVSASVTQEKT